MEFPPNQGISFCDPNPFARSCAKGLGFSWFIDWLRARAASARFSSIMGVNLSTPVAGTSGCFRDQLQYHNEHDWRLPSFNFPLPITVFSVEAGKEFECTFMIDGERVADPYLKFHPKLFGIGPGSQLQARLISPQVVDYEVSLL